jgi:hypothetical protein
MRNTSVARVTDAVLQIDFVYEEGSKGTHLPVARTIVRENVTVRETPRVLNGVGFPGAEISAVRIFNSTFKKVRGKDVVKDAGDVKLVDCVVEPVK